MLDYAREAAEMTKARTRADLDKDRMLSLALTRLLEILGEAAARVSTQRRAMHPEIPWSQIIGLRNRLIHGYDAINHDVVWQIIQHDLPPLIASLEKISQTRKADHGPG